MWLKRTHAWTGIFGAVMFLVIGISAVLLNHRGTMKIDTGAPTETANVNVAVDPQKMTSIEAFQQWLFSEFSLSSGRAYPKVSPSETVQFEGKTITLPEAWEITVYAPNSTIKASHTTGSNNINVRSTANNFWGILKNMHKGSGFGVAWILFFDVLAGSFIFMSLSGILLWSKLHGTRLLGVGLITGSIGLALIAGIPAIMTSTL